MASATLAFGVEPCSVPYRLRLARYPALAQSVARFARARGAGRRQPLDLLDVGVGSGRSRRFIEAHLEDDCIRYHGVDRFPYGHSFVYKHESWSLYEACLEGGLPLLESDRFDVVLCEQVLEHLHHAESAAQELVRVLKPGGLLIAGVPIFPFGLHVLRRHLVPVVDRWLPLKKDRGHVRAFSLRSFVRMLRGAGPLEISAVRGFRIVSGGPLRALECCCWWWRLNCLVGSAVPGLCIEAQVLATKTRASCPAVPTREAKGRRLPPCASFPERSSVAAGPGSPAAGCFAGSPHTSE